MAKIMNITKDKKTDELVIRLKLKQPSYDAIGEYAGNVNNLVGILAGNDYHLSQLIDLAYKGDQQEGMPLVMFESKDELERVCKEFGIQLRTLPVCAYCQKTIRGLFTVGEKGNQCYDCELLDKKKV